MQRLRSEDHIDERRTIAIAFAFLAGDATANADHDVRSLFLQLPPAPERRKYLLLRFLADRAGVHQQQIRLVCIRRQLITMRLTQDVRHLVRVVLVHLAAHRLYEKFFAHVDLKRGNTPIVYPDCRQDPTRTECRRRSRPDRAAAARFAVPSRTKNSWARNRRHRRHCHRDRRASASRQQ